MDLVHPDTLITESVININIRMQWKMKEENQEIKIQVTLHPESRAILSVRPFASDL